MSIQIPRGTADVLPGEVEKWQYIENVIRDVCQRFNYDEIRTPIFEHTELFRRGVGETTDIVEKEMYTFMDRGERSLTLRPEGTAPVVRSYVENKLFGIPGQPIKLFYIGQMFRYERPQAGRTRQFTQFGVEAIGSTDPAIDAEVITLAVRMFEQLGLRNLSVNLNTLGNTVSRTAHREALIAHFEPHIEEFCEDCQSRLVRNPLRILDCKKDTGKDLMKSAPITLDYLDEESSTYFKKVKSLLDQLGVVYEVNPNLVRGIDYYNHTAFEIMENGIGAVSTILGGGRYNGLVEQLGGPDMAGIGFGVSIERILLALKTQEIDLPIAKGLDCYVVSLSEATDEATFGLLDQVRSAGIKADKDYLGRKMKAQMKSADRENARFVILIGEDELAKNVANVKELATGQQEEVPMNEVTKYVKARL